MPSVVINAAARGASRLQFSIYMDKRRVAARVKHGDLKAYWKNGNIGHVLYREQLRGSVGHAARGRLPANLMCAELPATAFHLSQAHRLHYARKGVVTELKHLPFANSLTDDFDRGFHELSPVSEYRRRSLCLSRNIHAPSGPAVKKDHGGLASCGRLARSVTSTTGKIACADSSAVSSRTGWSSDPLPRVRY
jgi:hypothetical protein